MQLPSDPSDPTVTTITPFKSAHDQTFGPSTSCLHTVLICNEEKQQWIVYQFKIFVFNRYWFSLRQINVHCSARGIVYQVNLFYAGGICCHVYNNNEYQVLIVLVFKFKCYDIANVQCICYPGVKTCHCFDNIVCAQSSVK